MSSFCDRVQEYSAEAVFSSHLVTQIVDELTVLECGIALLDGHDSSLATVVFRESAVREREKGAEAVEHALSSACTQQSGF